MYEFLPLCDVLFNIISLVSYFCDIVFDIILAYTLYIENQSIWCWTASSFILFSLLASQICSFMWYISEIKSRKESNYNIVIIILAHIFQCGILFRYFRLFIPVDLRYVKNDVRDLCILRLVHAFCEAAPMLLIQLYLIWLKPSFAEVTDLNIVSTALSLFTLSWALASFNKYVRRHNMHRLIMTWLGVIFQLLWRLGTISSRSIALSVYATMYGYWVFLVIALHWISMFLWLISPKNVFHGEKIALHRKILMSLLIGFCYNFCYINLQEANSRHKVIAFYVTMALENTLLISVWLGGLSSSPWYQNGSIALLYVSFLFGLFFMMIYYRHFHIRRFQHNYDAQDANNTYRSCSGCQIGDCSNKFHKKAFTQSYNDATTLSTESVGRPNKKPNGEKQKELSAINRDSFNVPGVFNCRFNPVIKRKRKKPTSFVPTPLSIANIGFTANETSGKMQLPFWKRPLPTQANCSDLDESVGSRINIQQKLLEKKQQQVAELRKIEEEIRSGQLKKPPLNDLSGGEALKQPIPPSKKIPWNRPKDSEYQYITPISTHGSPTKRMRSQTPEILLAPHYFENTRIYYEYSDPRYKYGNNYHFPSDELSGSSEVSKRSVDGRLRLHGETDEAKASKKLYKSCRVPSDLDSQISIPRSYTLPREFKYYRKNKSRKALRLDHFFNSTNSSDDGDVDSADENEYSSPYPTQPDFVGHSGHSHHNAPHYHNRFRRKAPVYQQPTTPTRNSRKSRPKLPLKVKLKPPFRGRSGTTINTHETPL